MKDFSELSAIHLVLSHGEAHTEHILALRRTRAAESGGPVHFTTSVPQESKQVVTAFEPVQDRPESYPLELPFVPYAEVWVTLFSDSRALPSARWPCSLKTGRVILPSVVMQSRLDGWETIVEPRERLIGSAIMQTRLQRGQVIRFVTLASGAQQWIVQLVHSSQFLPG